MRMQKLQPITSVSHTRTTLTGLVLRWMIWMRLSQTSRKLLKDNIYELILRAPDGRERRELAWFPNDRVRQDFYDKARKRGLEVIENNNE